MSMIYLQALGVWMVMFVLAIVNGVLRNNVYGVRLRDELRAHQISSFTAIIMFLATIYAFLRWTNADYAWEDLLVVGGIWTGLTITFEFVFGHYVGGHTWSRLLHDYNIREGRLWILVILTVLVGPFLIGTYLL